MTFEAYIKEVRQNFREAALGFAIAGVIILAACASQTPEDARRTAWIAGCETYASALNTLSAARDAGSLDALTVSRISQLEPRITSICDAPVPPTSQAALNELDRAVYELTSLAKPYTG